MTTVNQVLNAKQEIINSRTIWVRGVEITFKASKNYIFVQIRAMLVDKQPYNYESDEAFQTFVQSYKQGLRQGHHSLTIPKARTNNMDEFVYTSEAGTLGVLSGYANFEWDKSCLTEKELASGQFFLSKTSETLGTLTGGHFYTVIRFPTTSDPTIQQHQSLTDVIRSSQDSYWLMDYLNGRLLIFDEARAITLEPDQWNPLWVAALNENSAYQQLPYPLTSELKNYYFSRHDLKKRLGFDVKIAKVVPSGYTIKQSKEGQVKVVHYYHSDLVPQSFLCKCGKHPQQTGPLLERICWDCLAEYQENCICRSVERLDQQLTLNLRTSALEPVFVVMHTNQGQGKIGTIREIINICVMDKHQTILFQSLIRPTTTISKNNQERGYQTEMLKKAPTFEAIHDSFAQAIQGKLVIFFNAEERRSMYQAYCLQNGLIPEEMTHCMCLKEILIPISYGAKRLQKLMSMRERLVSKELRGLQMECSVLGILFPEQPSIQRDAMIMCQIYQTLYYKKNKTNLDDLNRLTRLEQKYSVSTSLF